MSALQQISNLGPTGAAISQFSYRYDQRVKSSNGSSSRAIPASNYALDYDQAGWLTAAAASGGPQTNAYLKQNYYAYDPAPPIALAIKALPLQEPDLPARSRPAMCSQSQ